MIQVNAMGDACPIPVVKTKKALQELKGPGAVETLVDNETAVQNLLAGKVDCVVIDKAPAQEYVKANAGLTILDTEYVTENYAIGVNKDNTALLDAINQEYIKTARAKGLKNSKIIFKHALRNALIPVITYVGPMVAYILTGSMVVENIFTIGGLGSSFVTSITNRDYTMIMATTIFLAILMVVANLLTDIAYKFVDPRITFE